MLQAVVPKGQQLWGQDSLTIQILEVVRIALSIVARARLVQYSKLCRDPKPQ